MLENWSTAEALRSLSDLMIAYFLAFPIGWDREGASRSAGLRTFPLVALGSCGFVRVGLETIATGASGAAADGMARILYGLMTGIGFIGGGAILKGNGSVRGTATAASLWITGAMGAAVAWHRYEIAVLLSLLTFLTLRCFPALKAKAQAQETDPEDSD